MNDPVQAALALAHTGPIHGADPGRTDTREISVPGESFVVPADVVSALGQGNTAHGFKILSSVYPPASQHRADGGKVAVPIIAADGEYVIGPEHVARIGGGDLKRGHQALRDAMTLIRNKHIQTLKKLPKTARG